MSSAGTRATSEQIQFANGIARKIKRVAEEKVEASTSHLAGTIPPTPTAAAGTARCGFGACQ
jgi:hypothetical protein